MSVTDTSTMSLVQWLPTLLYATALNGFIAYGGYKKKSLNVSGAVTGFIVGMLHACTGWSPISLLFLFFVSSSAATKRGHDRKKKLEDEYKEGGQRNWVQVLCNGGPQAFCCLLYLYYFGFSEGGLDFKQRYWQSSLIAAIMGGYACANGDTWSSEFGVLSKSEPILVTTLKRVPKGTNGGISFEGIAASVLGGCLIGLGLTLSSFLASGLQYHYFWWRTIFFGGLVGLNGSLLDSFLGATLQYSGWNPTIKKVVNKPHPNVKHISGIDFLDNHLVNFLSVTLATILTGLAASYFY